MMTAKRRGTSIRIFLIDGTPQGMRLTERIGWTGCCLSFSRSDYPQARQREELRHSGVYVLVGKDPDGLRPKLYIGEGEEVRVRLDSHYRDKEFWTNGFVLSTKDDSLNKAHIRYLEARLISIAQAAKMASVDNATNPLAAGRLSEPETSDMEAYLDEALVLLPLLGVTAFEIYDEPVVSETTAVAKDDQADITGKRYTLTAVLTEAQGYSDARGFAVLAGALARKESKVMVAGYARIRDELVKQGVLAEENEHQYRLTRTYVFDSPSSAASVLCGGSKNGRTIWKDDEGRTIKDNEVATAASPA